MREKITKLYTYDELSEDAQTKARDWYREAIAGDQNFADSVYDDAATLGALFGFDLYQRRIKMANGSFRWAVSIYYSISSSQGDGACFDAQWSASDVEPGALAKAAPQDAELQRIAATFERIAAAYPDARLSAQHSGLYSHAHGVTFGIDLCAPEDSDDTMRTAAEWVAIHDRDVAISNELKEASRQFMQWIYLQLRSAYEWENSSEVVAENIRANEYEFTADGKRGD